MFADERKATIVRHLDREKRVTVSELSEILSTSESTIRRDLQELEEIGQLKRTHGGAITLEVASFEPTWQEKDIQNSEAKVGIGGIGVTLIRDGQTVLFDAGTTTMQIARQLTVQHVTVVTNSVAIAMECSSKPNVHLVMLGGEFRATTGAFVGPFAEQMLAQLHVDVLFLGANGLHDRGVTTPNAVEAATKRAMVHSASQVIVAADSSKVGQVSFVQICDWRDVDRLITDLPLKEGELADSLQQNSVAVSWPKPE